MVWGTAIDATTCLCPTHHQRTQPRPFPAFPSSCCRPPLPHTSNQHLPHAHADPVLLHYLPQSPYSHVDLLGHLVGGHPQPPALLQPPLSKGNILQPLTTLARQHRPILTLP
ncbi:hypothetical protein BDR03DRAFT_953560 [Suillus americanus]|nr:hypothetical protein BDR03DRAFT_953560 [Suillus americanus]